MEPKADECGKEIKYKKKNRRNENKLKKTKIPITRSFISLIFFCRECYRADHRDSKTRDKGAK